jgi:hypothetical protein
MPELRQKTEIQNDIIKYLQEIKESCETGLSLANTLENADDTSKLFNFLETINEKTDEIRSLIFEIEDTFFREEGKKE